MESRDMVQRNLWIPMERLTILDIVAFLKVQLFRNWYSSFDNIGLITALNLQQLLLSAFSLWLPNFKRLHDVIIPDFIFVLD